MSHHSPLTLLVVLRMSRTSPQTNLCNITIQIKLLFKKDTLRNCVILEKNVSSKKRTSMIEKYCWGLVLQYRDYDCALLYFQYTLAVIP